MIWTTSDRFYATALLAEGCAWGFYCFLFLFTMVICGMNRTKSNPTDKPLLVGTVAIFLVCSSHFLIVVTDLGSRASSGNVDSLYGSSLGVSTAYTSVNYLANIIGDLMLLYRLWHFYKASRRIYLVMALPMLITLGSLGVITTFSVYVYVLRINQETWPSGFPWYGGAAFGALDFASNLLPLCTNVIVTSLIIGRVVHLAKLSSRSSTDRLLRRVIATFLDSGVLFLIAQLSCFILIYYQLNNWLVVAAFLTVQIYGISCTLITAGVALNALSFASSNPTLCIQSVSQVPRFGGVPLDQAKSGVHVMRFASNDETPSSRPLSPKLDQEEKPVDTIV